MQFRLREVGTGEDETEVSIGRYIPSGSLGVVAILYVLARPPSYDEVAEASTE
jgi:hypothetical protein